MTVDISIRDQRVELLRVDTTQITNTLLVRLIVINSRPPEVPTISLFGFPYY